MPWTRSVGLLISVSEGSIREAPLGKQGDGGMGQEGSGSYRGLLAPFRLPYPFEINESGLTPQGLDGIGAVARRAGR